MTDYNNHDPEYTSPVIEKLIAEIEEDTKMDEMNMKDKCLRLITRKHYYVGIYVRKKYEMHKLEIKKNDLMSKAIEQLRANSPVGAVTDAQLMKRASGAQVIKQMDEKLKEGAIILNLLELTNKNFSELVYLSKSVVDLMKLEET